MTNVYVVLSYDLVFRDEDDSCIKAICSSEEKAFQVMDPDLDVVEQWELDSQAEDARQTIY